LAQAILAQAIWAQVSFVVQGMIEDALVGIDCASSRPVGLLQKFIA